MAYCTADQARKKLNNKSKTEILDAFVEDCISDADALIDSKLEGKYTVPFSPTPAIIEAISKNISAYMVAADKNPIMSGPEGTPGRLEANYKLALEWLDALKNGKMNITDVAAEHIGLNSTTKGYSPVFNLDDEENYDADSDLLEEIEDDRE